MILVHDCPRCFAKNTAFTYAAHTRKGNIFHAIFTCPKCLDPVTVKFHSEQDIELSDPMGDLQDLHAVSIDWIEPKQPIFRVPGHVPKLAASLFSEACDNLSADKPTSAAAMFRKCMEAALREFAPDIEAWKLEKRIDALAEKHLITPAIKEWAHELRLDGNEALHDIAQAPKELAIRMERLTFFLLIYLYTLPKEVELTRENRQDKKEKTMPKSHAAKLLS